MQTKRSCIGIIACAVLEDELEFYRKEFSHIAAIKFMEQGLHNEPEKLRFELQLAIDEMERDFPAVDNIALVYGLCSRGIEGVSCRRANLVVARAHDCITLFMGDRFLYASYVAENPGTYWYTPGWNNCHLPPGKERFETVYREYLEKYGEDNADYLMELEQQWVRDYNRAAFIDLGVGDIEKEIAFTKECSDYLGWQFERVSGRSGLFVDLISGNWDERFVIAGAGETFRMTGDDRVLEVIPATIVTDMNQ